MSYVTRLFRRGHEVVAAGVPGHAWGPSTRFAPSGQASRVLVVGLRAEDLERIVDPLVWSGHEVVALAELTPAASRAIGGAPAVIASGAGVVRVLQAMRDGALRPRRAVLVGALSSFPGVETLSLFDFGNANAVPRIVAFVNREPAGLTAAALDAFLFERETRAA